MPDRVGRNEPRIEMNALDLCIRREHLERSALGLDDGSIVAWADEDPGGHGQPRTDSVDERALAEGGDCQ
jgi:hypothetical protein